MLPNPSSRAEPALCQRTESEDAPAILIADDDEGVRRLVRDLLDEQQYVIWEAADGSEALAQMSRNRIDLVILDLVMPEQEGIETLHIIREEYPDAKVLAISGAFGGSFLNCARALGAHAALKKPFPQDALLTKVRELLRA